MAQPEHPAAATAAQTPASASGFTGAIGKLLWSIPLGWQLSALYAVLLVATLSLVGSVVYSQQETFLVDDTMARLNAEARRIVDLPAPPQHSDRGQQALGSGLGPSDGPPPGETQRRLTENLLRGLSGPGVTVAILDTDGKVITTTQALEGGTLPMVDPVNSAQAAAAVQGGKPVQWIASRDTGGRQAVVLMSVTLHPFDAATGQDTTTTLLVEQSASLSAVDAALERLRTYLLLGVIVGTVVGVPLVLAFTRGVLHSLDRMADTADAIAYGDLHRRLQLPEGRNEVARLGKAFDYMVGRLVATLEVQRRFIADASHELRTPLTSLKGMAEILVIGAHGNDTRVIEQSAQAINSELERLIRLVTDLLTLSRLDSTGGATAPATRKTQMDVCSTVSAAVTQMAPLAEAREVRLLQQCAPPLWIVGDAGQLKQVLLNLLDNALRYTPKGGEVKLSAAPRDTRPG